jgi:hypothetical protein
MLQHQSNPVKLQIGGMFTGEKTHATIGQALKKSGYLSRRPVSSNGRKAVDLEKIVNEAKNLVTGKELVFHENGGYTRKSTTTFSKELGHKVNGSAPVLYNHSYFTVEATNVHLLTEEDKHWLQFMAKKIVNKKINEVRNN